jgi:hypothetical protein
MIRWKALLVLCVALYVPGPVFGQTVTTPPAVPDQEALAARLASKQWSVRREAASEILQIPAERRSPMLVTAVLNEVDRLQTLPGVGSLEVPKDITDRETGWDYYVDLMEVVCASNDPVVIPTIVKALDMGSPVTEALVRFGDAAAPQMFSAIQLKSHVPDFVMMGLHIFRRMLERHEDLSHQTRAGIEQLTEQYLSGRQYSFMLESAIDLAGALKEPRFRPVLTKIAEARTFEEAGLDVMDRFQAPSIEPFRQRARAALEKIK